MKLTGLQIRSSRSIAKHNRAPWLCWGLPVFALLAACPGSTNQGSEGAPLGDGGPSEAAPLGDGGQTDSCEDALCTAPPPAVCEDSTHLISYAQIGTCAADGTCRYGMTRVACAHGCDRSECLNEPCSGVSCTQPPADRCLDLNTLTVYANSGVCSEGACDYDSSLVLCEHGCADGSCLDGPCSGVACDTPPASSCDGDDLLAYSASGTCNRGACQYELLRTTCEQRCEAGQCVADPCAEPTVWNGDASASDLPTLCADACALRISGSLRVDDTSLTNLDALHCLVAVDGNLQLSGNAHLADIAGLSGVRSIGRSLVLYDNGSLTDLAALARLRTVGTLSIVNNERLESIAGLSGLEGNTGSIHVNYNDALASLQGLEGLTSAERLEITGNNLLTSLSGLNGLVAVSGDVTVWDNAGLTNLHGLEHLGSTGGTLWLRNNRALVSLSGLDGLTLVQHDLKLEGNSALADLSALRELARVGRSFTIVNAAATNLAGLDALKVVGNTLGLYHNAVLADVSALTSLRSVDIIHLENDPSLASLAGLEGITALGGLSMTNTGITDFRGLDHLATVDGILSVYENRALLSLSGLERVTRVGMLYLGYNSHLSDVTGLSSLELVSHDLTIEHNSALSLDAANALVQSIDSIGGRVIVR